MARTDELNELVTLQGERVVSTFGARLLKAGEKDIDKTLLELYPEPAIVEPIKKVIHGRPRRVGWRRIEAGVSTDGQPVVKYRPNRNVRESAVNTSVILKAPWIWPSLVRSILPVNLKHRYFSEYWTAFVFASLPLLIYVFTHIDYWVELVLRSISETM